MMPLPRVLYEDSVRLELLCQTVGKLFSENGDEKVLGIKKKLRILGFGATPGGGRGIFKLYHILFFYWKALNIF